MHCFFIDPNQAAGESIVLTGPEAHHLINVLRMAPGQAIELFDGSGLRLMCTITAIKHGTVILQVDQRTVDRPPAAPLTLAQAMLKGKKMDFLIQKATELGVHSFQPLLTRFCEKKTHNSRQAERWQRIMLEACKQCGRALPMEIREPLPLDRCEFDRESSLLMPWEDEQSRPLSPALLRRDRPVWLLIGPEGGFHDAEAALARKLGFTTVSLGSRILRAETAALACISIVQYLCGEFDPGEPRD
jgi:16S rRNA (uracil1498-N3)-methyltransferase